MEKLKVKHDHKLTDILKVGIFCLFLILPILCFLPSCIYYGFNEHATAQTSEVNTTIETETTNAINYENATDIPLSNSDIELNKMYLWDSRKVTSFPSFNGSAQCTYINIIDYSNGVTIQSNIANKSISYLLNVSLDTGTQRYTFNQNNDYVIALVMLSNQSTNWTGFYTGLQIPTFNVNQSSTTETTTTTTEQTYTMDISTSINQAWESIWNTPLLSWTDNNTFKFTINSFCNVFAITQESYITNYLTYILTMTCIYLIFDIVISISTKLTQMLTNSKD